MPSVDVCDTFVIPLAVAGASGLWIAFRIVQHAARSPIF